jgi:hypothetical protein
VALANPATGPMIALDLKTNASTGKATGTIGIGEHLVKYVTLQLEEGSVAGKTVKFKTRVKVNDAVQETSWLAELTDSGELTLREERPNKTIRTYSLRRAK